MEEGKQGHASHDQSGPQMPCGGLGTLVGRTGRPSWKGQLPLSETWNAVLCVPASVGLWDSGCGTHTHRAGFLLCGTTDALEWRTPCRAILVTAGWLTASLPSTHYILITLHTNKARQSTMSPNTVACPGCHLFLPTENYGSRDTKQGPGLCRAVRFT